MPTPQMSPTPRKKPPPELDDKVEMTFYQALEQVADGKIVSKKEWENPEIQCGVQNEKLMIKTDDGLWHPWTVSLGDMVGEDWFVL